MPGCLHSESQRDIYIQGLGSRTWAGFHFEKLKSPQIFLGMRKQAGVVFGSQQDRPNPARPCGIEARKPNKSSARSAACLHRQRLVLSSEASQPAEQIFLWMSICKPVAVEPIPIPYLASRHLACRILTKMLERGCATIELVRCQRPSMCSTHRTK
jgi:hypothetical protein